MTWVSWRLHRTQLLIAGAFAVAVVGTMSATGTSGAWVQEDGLRAQVIVTLYALPVVAGIIMGTTVTARERERLTNRLAWTQGISRTRWLVSSLWPVALAGAVGVGAVSAVATWWVDAVHLGTRVQPTPFDISGVVPVAYFLGALALGVLAGSVLRNEGLAGAVAVVATVAFRVVVRSDVRAHLAPVRHQALATAPPFDLGPIWSAVPGTATLQDSWVVAQGFVPVGRTSPVPGHPWLQVNVLYDRCPSVTQAAQVSRDWVRECAGSLHLHYVAAYQPLGHYWVLQLGEAGIFVASAALAVGLAVLLLRRSSE